MFCNLGFVYIECEKNNTIWLRYQVITPFDVDELVDAQGRHTVGQYTVSQGKNLYFKLDNDEILILKCSLRRKIQNGYYTGNNHIYKQYNYYSYFKLTKEQIQKLKEHEIIKMRAEMKFDVRDIELSKENKTMAERFDELQIKKNKKSDQEDSQDAINNNPLKGF